MILDEIVTCIENQDAVDHDGLMVLIAELTRLREENEALRDCSPTFQEFWKDAGRREAIKEAVEKQERTGELCVTG